MNPPPPQPTGRIHAEVRVHAPQGAKLLHRDASLERTGMSRYYSGRDAKVGAVELLRKHGFEILHVGRLSISIAGSRDTYRAAFGAMVSLDPTSRVWEVEGAADPTLIEPTGEWANVVEGIVLHRDYQRSDASPNPPPVGFFHLDPRAMLERLDVLPAHACDVRGQGVHVVIVDTGFFDHPYFQARDMWAQVVLPPGIEHPYRDEVGHGTMVASNLLTIAPAAKVTVVKEDGYNILLPFKIAMDLEPAIIQNTWGFDKSSGPLSSFERLVVATVRDAVERGITVVFAGGNGNFLLTAQIPEIVSVGGVFVDAEGNRQAASYASGYASQVFEGRNVPDVCGLVGLNPNGVYLNLPTEPDSEIDVAFAAKPYPDGDGGDPTDGWVVISGTSAGSAQISGISALIKQVNPALSPAQVKSILLATARPVLRGESSQGNPAGPGVPSVAVGYGLVSAWQAVRLAIEIRI